MTEFNSNEFIQSELFNDTAAELGNTMLQKVQSEAEVALQAFPKEARIPQVRAELVTHSLVMLIGNLIVQLSTPAAMAKTTDATITMLRITVASLLTEHPAFRGNLTEADIEKIALGEK